MCEPLAQHMGLDSCLGPLPIASITASCSTAIPLRTCRYSPEQLYDVVSKVENYKVGSYCFEKQCKLPMLPQCHEPAASVLNLSNAFLPVQEFVPWCERSTVLERRGDNYMEAELEVGFKVFVER